MKFLRSRCLIAALFVVTMQVSPWLGAFNLPVLGNSNQQVLPIHTEKKLGLMLYQQLNQRVPMIHDPLLENYIQTLGDRLVAHADEQPFKFRFFFINHGAVNAFTGPGGYVAIHSGLMTAVGNEAELAAVMSHEISHATQRHIARGMERAKLSSLANIATLVAAAALGAVTKDGNAATGALMSASALNMENRLGYSRAQEQEADRLGISLLYRSGYDPHSMPKFLKTLGRIAGVDRSLVAELLSTHPLTDFRIADTQNRARQFEPRPYRSANHKFNMMRARLLVFSSTRPDRTLRLFNAQLEGNQQDQFSEDRIALEYGHALALLKTGQPKAALKEMRHLAKIHPKDTTFAMGVGEILDKQGQYAEARDVLAKEYRWYPDYEPLVQQYADTLVAAEQPSYALKILETYFEDHSQNSAMSRIAARAYAAKKQMAEAYLYNARADLIDGRFRSAYQLAQQGMRCKHIPQSTKRHLNKVLKKSEELNVPIKL